MRRRLAIAILLTVWAMLLIAAMVVYAGVRSILVDDLDSLLFARASALPELLHPAGVDPMQVPVYDWQDRYLIHSVPGQTPTTRPVRNAVTPQLIAGRFTVDGEGRRWRTVTVVATASAPGGPVRVEYSGRTERIDALLRKIAMALIVFIIIAAALAAGMAMWVSGVVLRPLASTAQWLSKIDEMKLDARVSLDELPPELLPVSDRLNKMLSKLEKAFEEQKQFLATASHELRMPVSAMENALASAESDLDPSRPALRQLRSQVAVMRGLVDRLSEYITDARRATHAAEVVDVVALVNQCADTAATLGQPAHVTVKRTGPSQLRCVLPITRLRSIVNNLLANAIEYNRPGGRVEITFFHDGNQIHLRVSDDGPGVAPEHVPHLFEPFYRADKTSGHLGLGLFIVQSHVKSLNGLVRVDSRTGQGTAVDVEFPCEGATTASLAGTIAAG